MIDPTSRRDGLKSRARERRPEPINVLDIRERMGISQSQFARMFGIALGTLRHWEHGERRPRGPSMVLLHVLAREPQAVLRALRRNVFRKRMRRAIYLEDIHPVMERQPLVMTVPGDASGPNQITPDAAA